MPSWWSCWSGSASEFERQRSGLTRVRFTRQLYNMLQLARVMAQGAAMRDESRGAHYKPDFPERDDKNLVEDNEGDVCAGCG